MKLNNVGMFQAVVTAAAITESAVKKTPGLELTLEVVDGECAGHQISHTMYFGDTHGVDKDGNTTPTMTQKMASRLFEVFSFVATEQEPSDLVGLPCRIETVQDSFTGSSGKVFSSVKVKYLNRAGGGRSSEKANESKAASLWSKLRKESAVVAKQAAINGDRVPAKAAKTSAAAQSDDIPF